jgi:hypothetical protein
MKNGLLPILLLMPIATALAAPPAADPPQAPINLTPGAVATPEMVKALADKDRALFDAVFGCKPDLLVPMVAEDFEFLHDKHGMTATSGAQFIASIRDMCEGQKTGRNGAMQMGTHRFYALQSGKPDQLTETGRFIDVWKLENGAWKLARVISYDHVLARDEAK